MNAIIGSYLTDLKDASLLVVRIDANRNITMSKPCPACMHLIRAAGIKDLFYSNFEGKIIKERVI